MYKNNQITSTKCQYQMANSKFMLCIFGLRESMVKRLEQDDSRAGMDQSLLDPTRMVHLSVHLTAVVVIAAYSAALISYLAIKTFVMPFTTMKGLLEDGGYRFAVVANSAEYSFFQASVYPFVRLRYN